MENCKQQEVKVKGKKLACQELIEWMQQVRMQLWDLPGTWHESQASAGCCIVMYAKMGIGQGRWLGGRHMLVGG